VNSPTDPRLQDVAEQRIILHVAARSDGAPGRMMARDVE
jgi:hypothetical protein